MQIMTATTRGFTVLSAALIAIVIHAACAELNDMQDVLCACGPAGKADSSLCPTRAFFKSSHRCESCAGQTCSRLSEQICGPDLECEKSFGLSCDPIVSVCKGL